MCRLLGVIANKPVHFEFSCKHFKPFGEENPNGWGIGWYDIEGHAKIEKEAVRADKSKNYDNICHEIHSHLIIEHVRRASCGRICKENSHPFEFKNWIFAHNGGVNKESLLEKLQPEYHDRLWDDCTDSEVYFRFLIQNIDEKQGNVIEGIRHGLETIKKEVCHGSLNFLLSDGDKLYAYCNGETLHFLERNPEKPYGHNSFEHLSEETQLLIHSKSLNHEKAVIVCSEEIPKKNKNSKEPEEPEKPKGPWKPMKEGQLLIIDKNLHIPEEPIFI